MISSPVNVRLSVDFSAVNAFIRRPEIWPMVSGAGNAEDFDLGGVPGFLAEVTAAGNVLGWFYVAATGEPGVGLVHTLLTVTGSDALAAGRAALDWCFRTSNLSALISYTNPNNRRAAVYASLMGFKPHMVLDGVQFVILRKTEEPCP